MSLPIKLCGEYIRTKSSGHEGGEERADSNGGIEGEIT